jgi:DNA mismatch repair protein MSH2
MFKIVAGYYPVMERLSSTLAELDVLIGWSTIVSTATERWSKPSFSNNLTGLQMRHPCVKNCVSNDIHIDHNKTIILTGPNMGGKSTYIRTIGVCSYLAHLGMFVPATSF